MKLHGKKLLLLGGSRNSKEILDCARGMGVFVGVTDWYGTDRSPVKQMADQAFDVSIQDYQGLQKIFLDNGYDGVMTGYTDSYLVPYARLCRRLNLACYGREEHFALLTDKSRYKPLLEEFGVPVLPSYAMEEIDGDFRSYPLLLKPVRGSGGKGLLRVNDYREFLRARDAHEEGGEPVFLAEPYIENRRELTAFFLFIDGEVYLSGTANRFLSKPQGDKIALPLLYSMPASYDALFRETAAPPLMRMFRSLGMQNGLLFAQCLIHEGLPRVYDMGYRLSGSLEYKLQEKLYGFNPLQMMIRHSLTGHMLAPGAVFDPGSAAGKGLHGFNVTMLGRQGRLAGIEGEKKVRGIPQLIDCVFKLVEGDSIEREMMGTLGQIIARLFFTAESLEEAAGVLTTIYRHFHVYDQQGRDMILDRFLPQELFSAYS